MSELELTIRELNAIGKHLAKVNEIHRQNTDYENEIDLDLPESISLDRTTNGMTLGHIKYSEDLEEHVFVPFSKKPEEPPKWASSIPLPPQF